MSNHNELLASHRILSMLESACEYSEKMLDNIPSVFVVLNENNRVIRANKSFCELVGCAPEQALNLDFSALFSTENREILFHHLDILRADERSDSTVQVKIEFSGVDGTKPAKPFFWRIFRLEHISEAEGRVISIVGEDLSDFYQSELKLMNIFSSIPLGLMVVDRFGFISEVLSEYCHVLLGRRQLVGGSLADMLSKDNPDLSVELAKTFEILLNCAGVEATFFAEREPALGLSSQLKAGGGKADRWMKIRFQPIVSNNKTDRYMVVIEDTTVNTLAQQKIEKADLLGKQAQALYECAIRDTLSGLYTRLFMNDSVSRLIASAARGNFHELTLVMFDLDSFKSVNDTYGHPVGDIVIREFGKIILKCTRETDVAVRYGGEEFLVALPTNTATDHGGRIVAERIRHMLESNPIDIGDGKMLRVTTSCGVAYCNKADTIESLVARADSYLYTAKHGGKNRVCCEDEPAAD